VAYGPCQRCRRLWWGGLGGWNGWFLWLSLSACLGGGLGAGLRCRRLGASRLIIDIHGLRHVPVVIEHYPPEATGGGGETFDLVVFAHHEVREVTSGGVRRKELGPPTWKPLGRCSVEVLVGYPV
jgi:hypothetical protein